ncbi:3-ketoacyl-CoA synthase 5-like [Cynara cardunculus var. scolymus]|nr:3-ketoacyl-CoA synthase 5-like [Cynara cardunculus var. scolymus]
MSKKFAEEAFEYLICHAHILLLILLTLSISTHASQQGLGSHLNSLHYLLLNLSFIHYIKITFLLLIIIKLTFSFLIKPPTVYLLDFACFKPPPRFRVPFATAYEHGRLILASEPKSIEFQLRIFERAGLGEETSLPHPLHYLPPRPTLIGAREETELVIFSAMDSLFQQTGISPHDIDIVIVNCSLFLPTPSLSAMVIHKYNMRSNVKSYNLSGMGCSAGLIAIDLAKHLLQVHPESNAVVVSTEIITPNSYMGKERSMLLPNCLFRMGGASILLTNKTSLRKHAKYSLLHVVRTHKGGEDKSYGCVMQEEDSEGHVGIALSMDLMVIAAKSLKSNISALGSLVLPVSEQVSFLFNFLARKIFKLQWKPYIPDFRKAFDHFCIHAGGRAVIGEIQKSLKLSDEHVEASRMTLHRFGNTSSSSVWYQMGYIEAKGRMKKGDRVWQIGFGSGFKCNSVVWKCNREIEAPKIGAWADRIHKYPVFVPEVLKL